jgi:hypothetical protein
MEPLIMRMRIFDEILIRYDVIVKNINSIFTVS